MGVLIAHGGTVELSQLTRETYDDVPSVFHMLAELSVLAHLGKLEKDGRTRRDGSRVIAC